MSDRKTIVLGIDGHGSHCLREVLTHGADPGDLLAAAGWEPVALAGVAPVEEGVALVFRVRRCPPRSVPEPSPRLTVSARDAATAVRRQRVAAYALVESVRGVLLTEFSERTARAGTWGLPGGGLEPGEHPDEGVLREVWEESGQPVDLEAPWTVRTDHWVGTAPSGVIEDFHAVRVIYRAHCQHPTDPVVHDVGGTTRSAAWWRPAELSRLDITPWTRALLTEIDG